MFNDLVGLRYRWGAKPSDGEGYTDCFQLVCEVRRRLDLKDWSEHFQWVYEKFPEGGLPVYSIPRWVLKYGTKCAIPKPGDVMLLRVSGATALGAISGEGVLYISSDCHVVHPSIIPPLPAFSFDR